MRPLIDEKLTINQKNQNSVIQYRQNSQQLNKEIMGVINTTTSTKANRFAIFSKNQAKSSTKNNKTSRQHHANFFKHTKKNHYLLDFPESIEQAHFNMICLESHINEGIISAKEAHQLTSCQCLNLYGLKSYITEGKLSIAQVLSLNETERLDIYSSRDISKYQNRNFGA
tara:strand:+ start:346 stop:855 length:510 start_codon:yes stop_codon:yes gene_type:complete